MTLSDKISTWQVIGGLMKNTLLLAEYSDININEDFDDKVARVCYFAIYNLYQEGASKLTEIEVDQEICKNESSAMAILTSPSTKRTL